LPAKFLVQLQIGNGSNEAPNGRLGRRVQSVNAKLLAVYRQAFQAQDCPWALVEA
jgi:hypothetical protein